MTEKAAADATLEKLMKDAARVAELVRREVQVSRKEQTVLATGFQCLLAQRASIKEHPE